MIYVLHNPRSNNGNTGDALEKVKNKVSGREYKVVNLIEVTDYDELARRIKKDDAIYLIGGDGTLNRFINYTKNIELPEEVFFYSAGTGNDFLRDIDETMKTDCINLTKYIKSLPIVRIYDKEYRFINGIGFGIDGYCCEEGDRIQAKSNKPANYTKIAIIGILRKFSARNAKVTVDGVTHELKKVWLAPTMIGRYFGGGMKITPEQNRLNEEHTVTNLVMYGKSRLTTLIRFPKVFTGQHIKYPDMLDVREGHEVTVEFDRPCALQVDGETFLNVTKYSVKY